MVCGRTLGLDLAIPNKEHTGCANNKGLLVQQVPAVYGSGIPKEKNVLAESLAIFQENFSFSIDSIGLVSEHL